MDTESNCTIRMCDGSTQVLIIRETIPIKDSRSF